MNVYMRTIILIITSLLILSCSSLKKTDNEKTDMPSDYTEMILTGLDKIEALLVDKGYPSMETIDEVADSLGSVRISEDDMDKVYSKANATWKIFIDLCRQKKFKEAYDYYYNEDQMGDFLVFLTSTESKYIFFKDVLMPLDSTYDKEHSLEKFVNNMELDLLLTTTVIKISDGVNIPPHYAELVTMCYMGNIRLGNYDKAREIVNDHVKFVVLNCDGGSEDQADEIVKQMLEEINAKERRNDSYTSVTE